MSPGSTRNLKAGFNPHVLETDAASTAKLHAGWPPVRQGAAIAMMAEQTACGICPAGRRRPGPPPPRFAVAVAWRRGDHSGLPDQLLGFVRGYRGTAHAWCADTQRLRRLFTHRP